MKRPLLNLLTLASLLLCIAVCVLWARSYSGTDYVSRLKPMGGTANIISSRTHDIAFTRGGIRLSRSDYDYYTGRTPVEPSGPGAPIWGWGRLGRGHIKWDDPPGNSIWNRLGFHRYEQGTGASFYDERERGVVVPAWLAAALLATPPLLASARWLRRRHRRRAGLCAACGYDLRATPDTCPECGASATVRTSGEKRTGVRTVRTPAQQGPYEKPV